MRFVKKNGNKSNSDQTHLVDAKRGKVCLAAARASASDWLGRMLRYFSANHTVLVIIQNY